MGTIYTIHVVLIVFPITGVVHNTMSIDKTVHSGLLKKPFLSSYLTNGVKVSRARQEI